MTVAELIGLLQQQPQDATVTVYASEAEDGGLARRVIIEQRDDTESWRYLGGAWPAVLISHEAGGIGIRSRKGEPTMPRWPSEWDTVVEIRRHDPETGQVLRITVEQPVHSESASTSSNVSRARMDAKEAALDAFRALDLTALITPESVRGTDPENRLHVSAEPVFSGRGSRP